MNRHCCCCYHLKTKSKRWMSRLIPPGIRTQTNCFRMRRILGSCLRLGCPGNASGQYCRVSGMVTDIMFAFSQLKVIKIKVTTDNFFLSLQSLQFRRRRKVPKLTSVNGCPQLLKKALHWIFMRGHFQTRRLSSLLYY